MVCSSDTLPIGVVTDCMDDTAKIELKKRIRNANNTRLRILSDTPRPLQRLWSSCVTATIMKFAIAKTELESFAALECWVKLKSSIVLPLKAAGKQRKNAIHKFHERQMLMWIAGDYEECWKSAIEIECQRETLLKKKSNQKQKSYLNRKDKSGSRQSDTGNPDNGNKDEPSKEEKQMYRRAKNYVNVGELSKAMTAIRSNGIAAIDDEVLTQLQHKHSKRRQPVALPQINDESNLSSDQSDYIEEEKEEGESKVVSEEFSRHVSTILDGVPTSVTVTADNIMAAAKSARRLSSGGLQQITPWHLKRAL